jgi:hypothetical protein
MPSCTWQVNLGVEGCGCGRRTHAHQAPHLHAPPPSSRPVRRARTGSPAARPTGQRTRRPTVQGTPNCTSQPPFPRSLTRAGENIGSGEGFLSFTGRWTERKKHDILESRRQGTSLLAKALAATRAKPAVFVSASAVGFYGNGGDVELHEASPRGTGFLGDVARVWEECCEPAVSAGIRTVNARFGVILARDGGVVGEYAVTAAGGWAKGSGVLVSVWGSGCRRARFVAHLCAMRRAAPVVRAARRYGRSLSFVRSRCVCSCRGGSHSSVAHIVARGSVSVRSVITAAPHAGGMPPRARREAVLAVLGGSGRPHRRRGTVHELDRDRGRRAGHPTHHGQVKGGRGWEGMGGGGGRELQVDCQESAPHPRARR